MGIGRTTAPHGRVPEEERPSTRRVEVVNRLSIIFN
jgi:hypothetical protein